MSVVWRPAVELVRMRVDQVDVIHAIEASIYDYPWTRNNLCDSITAGYDCYEYRRGAALIGYSVMMTVIDEVHLLNLSIAASFQRQGFGKALLGELCAIARRKSAQSMLLEVRPSNTAARRLYAGAGFVEVGIRRAYYPAHDGREDAMVLKLAL